MSFISCQDFTENLQWHTRPPLTLNYLYFESKPFTKINPQMGKLTKSCCKNLVSRV